MVYGIVIQINREFRCTCRGDPGEERLDVSPSGYCAICQVIPVIEELNRRRQCERHKAVLYRPGTGRA